MSGTEQVACAAKTSSLKSKLIGHIDHIFPMPQGGCNDVVNLQLLCSTCNLQKLAKKEEVTTSVPRYIRRA